jgi:hypothetical protein
MNGYEAGNPAAIVVPKVRLAVVPKLSTVGDADVESLFSPRNFSTNNDNSVWVRNNGVANVSSRAETPRLRTRQGVAVSILPGESSHKRPRTPRAVSPTIDDVAAVTYSAAISRQNSMQRVQEEERNSAWKKQKKAKKKKKKGKFIKSTPQVMFEEIGCQCANCEAAKSTLTQGVSADNAIQLDQKSWLECFDEKHRYGAHLRPYYQRWLELGTPGKHFWAWLDGEPLVDLPDCPRALLERDVVTYLSPEQRQQFRVNIANGLLSWHNGSVFHTPGGEEWIFVVAAKDGHLYCHRKETKQIPRFQHTSFLGAEAVRVAGKLVVENGKLVALNLHSGHYRPREDRDLVTFLRLLERHGCCLSSISVDVQRIIKSARDGGIAGAAKKHKKDCEKLWRGSHTVWYLEHKRNASDFLADIRLLRSQIEYEAKACKALLPDGEVMHTRPSDLLPRLVGLRLDAKIAESSPDSTGPSPPSRCRS